MNILAVPYGTNHKKAVNVGDTLRILVSVPKDGNTWTGTYSITTSKSAVATATGSLADYSGKKVQHRNWDLFVNHDASDLTANTHYLVIAQLTSGTNYKEEITTIDVLAEGIA